MSARFNVRMVYVDKSEFLSQDSVSVRFKQTKSCVLKWCSFKEVSENGFVFSNHSELISEYSDEITLNKLKDSKKIPKEIKTIITQLDNEKKKEQKRNCRMSQKKRKSEEDITPNLTSLQTSYSPDVKRINYNQGIKDSGIFDIFCDLENDNLSNFFESEFSQNDDLVVNGSISQTSLSSEVETIKIVESYLNFNLHYDSAITQSISPCIFDDNDNLDI